MSGERIGTIGTGIVLATNVNEFHNVIAELFLADGAIIFNGGMIGSVALSVDHEGRPIAGGFASDAGAEIIVLGKPPFAGSFLFGWSG